MTRHEVNDLVCLFLASRQKHSLAIAIEAVADAAVEAFMSVDATPVTKSTTSAVKALIAEVCRGRGVPWKLVMGRGPGSRNREVSRVRRELMGRLEAMLFGPSAIGRFLGRDHATVIHGLAKFRAENPGLAATLSGDELGARRAAA